MRQHQLITDPQQKSFYRRAARLFHPDLTGKKEDYGAFVLATEAYNNGDLEGLQILVLQELSGRILKLNDEERNFLESQFETMRMVAEKIWNRAAEIIVEAANIEKMSQNYFQTEVEDAIRKMQDELNQTHVRQERETRPLSLEGN